MIGIIIAAVVAVLIIGLVAFRKVPRRLNAQKFTQRWSSIQRRCVDKASWHEIVMEADKLLDDALKRRRFKGKSTGERLVAAQHELTNNESAWFGHKLHNKIEDEHLKQISKQETLEALSGFRQALRDLGALIIPEHSTTDTEKTDD
jgi:hypothetical protein